MIRIGAGHNPVYVRDRSTLPPAVDLIEGGIEELKFWQDGNAPPRLSLHLARTPITEDLPAQSAFTKKLQLAISGLQFCSIGLHVTGPRTSGIGRYGFSSHFITSKQAEQAAIDFLRSVQDAFGCSTWIENANFYSGSAYEVLRTTHSINRIASSSGSNLIVDLTHAHIDAANVGLSTDSVLGAVEWPLATEIHLAGLAIGADGTLHDGHSFPIADDIWRSLADCLKTGLIDDEMTITIEHTDLAWKHKLPELQGDFHRLTDIIRKTVPAKSREYDLDRIARSYIAKMLDKAVPGLSSSFDDADIDLQKTIQAWLESRFDDDHFLIVLSRAETTLHISDNTAVFYAEDFLQYLEEEGIMSAED